jgi:hypothetical protein
LQTGRYEATLCGGANQEGGNSGDRDHHEGRRIGESDLGIADLGDREEIDNSELVYRIDSHEH